MSLYNVIKRPLVTEKSTVQKDALNMYAFEVHKQATKGDVKTAIEELFNVKVGAVKTLIQRGKIRRYGKDSGRTKAWKKAIVTLAEGKIELFDGV